MLIEALLAQAESFFPWGYPLDKTASALSMAGTQFAASPRPAER